MTDEEAIQITEKFLEVLEDKFLAITSSDLHEDRTKKPNEKKFPTLAAYTDNQVRELLLRGWLLPEVARGKISGGSDYTIIGPGSLWTHYKQQELTIGISKRAENKSWLAIGIGVGTIAATVIWFLYEIWKEST